MARSKSTAKHNKKVIASRKAKVMTLGCGDLYGNTDTDKIHRKVKALEHKTVKEANVRLSHTKFSAYSVTNKEATKQHGHYAPSFKSKEDRSNFKESEIKACTKEKNKLLSEYTKPMSFKKEIRYNQFSNR